MTTKEWIVLFLPIIVNGVMLFIFQKIIVNKFRLLQLKDDMKIEVIKDYRKLIVRGVEDVENVIHSINRDLPESGNFIMELNESIALIVNFYENYPNILVKSEILSNQLKNSANTWADILRSPVATRGADDTDNLISSINDTKATLRKLDEWCVELDF